MNLEIWHFAALGAVVISLAGLATAYLAWKYIFLPLFKLFDWFLKNRSM